MQRIPGHKTVTVCVGAWEADIDEEIALLIEEIWKADIMTMNSCQGNSLGIVWIEFLTADDATRFLNIVAEYDKEIDSLYNRIRHGWQRLNAKMSAPFWEYTTRPQDFAIQQQLDENDECLDEWHDGKNDFIFSVSIRFPRSDIPTLLERLRGYNGMKQEPAPRLAVPA